MEEKFWYKLNFDFAGEEHFIKLEEYFRMPNLKSNIHTSHYPIYQIIKIFSVMIDLGCVTRKEVITDGIFEFGSGNGLTAEFYITNNIKNYFAVEKEKKFYDTSGKYGNNFLRGDGIKYMNTTSLRFKFIITLLFGKPSKIDKKLFFDFFNNAYRILKKNGWIIFHSDIDNLKYLQNKIFTERWFKDKYDVKFFIMTETDLFYLIRLK